MSADFDIAILGSGFGGSILAMIARRLGRSVVMIERGRHPRFAIGESSTPLANLLLEQLAESYDLPRIASLSKWGTWQCDHPEIACGLKRGFSFYHHKFDEPWRETPDRRNELLVAASPRDAIADTHWYRPDFDAFLVGEAQAGGVEFLDETSVQDVSFAESGARFAISRKGETAKISARFLVDATGPRGCLHTLLGLKEAPFQFLPCTVGLYTHFRSVRHFEALVHSSEAPPYPVDNAALHHVFPDGWIWVLRFNNGITSAGVAANRELAEQLRLSDGAAGWKRLLERLPSVQAQFDLAEAILPFVFAPKLSFQAETICGPGWAMLPSAAGFVDPLLSTGFPLTLLGVTRLATVIEREWKSEAFATSVERFASQTRQELLLAELLVAALYHAMDDAELFSRISLLYFAAASFSESALRLGKRDLAGKSFLLDDHSEFGRPARDCLRHVLGNSHSRAELMSRTAQIIESIDIAGLGDFKRRNHYPARAEDLLAGRNKLHSSVEEILAMLKRTGFEA
jgi:FADH2 O2-dependent halogenase